MDLEFVERCKENSEFRGSHRDLFVTNVFKKIGLAIGAPPKAFLATTLLATGMERKRKGGSSDLPASFFAVS